MKVFLKQPLHSKLMDLNLINLNKEDFFLKTICILEYTDAPAHALDNNSSSNL